MPSERGLFEALGEVVDLDALLRGVLILKISEPSTAKSLAMSLPRAFKGDDLGSSKLKDSGIATREGRRRGEGPPSAVLGATGEIGAMVEADDTWVDGCPALRPDGCWWHFLEGVVGASPVVSDRRVDGRLEFICFGVEGGSGVSVVVTATDVTACSANCARLSFAALSIFTCFDARYCF